MGYLSPPHSPDSLPDTQYGYPFGSAYLVSSEARINAGSRGYVHECFRLCEADSRCKCATYIDYERLDNGSHAPQEFQNNRNVALQEKFHRRILMMGARNISDTCRLGAQQHQQNF